jgi:hypothetical protein
MFLRLGEFCAMLGLVSGQFNVNEEQHTFLRLPEINPQISIKYVKD